MGRYLDLLNSSLYLVSASVREPETVFDEVLISV